MKNCMAAITLFCTVSGSRALKAGDSYATADGFREAVLRQLKVMPPAKCTCQEGYVMRDGSCIRTVESHPQEVCLTGTIVEGLCITPAPPVLQCPDDHITVCKKKDRAESPCCAKGEVSEKISRCRDGTDPHDGQCTRMLAYAMLHECPPGYALSLHGTQCVREESGEAAPTCVAPDVLSPEGDACLTDVQQGAEYVCPEDYECVSYFKKKYKHKSPLCSACAKTQQTHPICGCPEGQEEVDGFCYEAGTQEMCLSRRGAPRKQAPPTKYAGPPAKDKDTYEEEPEINCKALGRPACSCEPPFILQCDDQPCTCIHRQTIPTIPVCRGHLDEEGNCIAQVKKRLLYRCPEGFTCDVVNKKGRCNCVRVSTVEPTTRCAGGEEHDGRCIEVIEEPKILECPPGYSENCCDDICACTKTTLTHREVKCAPGAISIQGECAYVSKPSAGCDEGLLRGETCVQELFALPTCG
ncbi:hypothetical protein Emag_005594 [Eimeria magna]